MQFGETTLEESLVHKCEGPKDLKSWAEYQLVEVAIIVGKSRSETAYGPRLVLLGYKRGDVCRGQGRTESR